MIIDENLLAKLEKLTAFKVPDEKRDEIKAQLNEIVNFVEVLNELDLDKTNAAITTLKGGTPFREDEPGNNNDEIMNIILKNAPDIDGSYFVVPKIID